MDGCLFFVFKEGRMSEQMDMIITIIGISIIIVGIGIGIYISIKKTKQAIKKTKQIINEATPTLKKAKEESINKVKGIKEGYKDFKKKYIAVDDLHIEFNLFPDFIRIKNNESFELKRFELKLNVQAVTSAFKYKMESLQPGETKEAQLKEFVDEKGYRLDKDKVKVYNLLINYDDDIKGLMVFGKDF